MTEITGWNPPALYIYDFDLDDVRPVTQVDIDELQRLRDYVAAIDVFIERIRKLREQA